MRSILTFLLLAWVCGCTPSSKEVSEINLKHTTAFKPAEFEDEQRFDKIKNAFPGIRKIYEDYAHANHIPGLAYGVVVGDSLVLAGGVGIINTRTQEPSSTQALYRIASMTKSFTAMAILKLRDEGKLKLTDAAAQYIPEMKNFEYLTEDATPITIQNLLTMTAGFPEDNPWGDRQLQDTDQELLDFLKGGVSFSSHPGQQFEYSNLGYAILGNIITRISGMPYQKYITQNILQPLGMTHTLWEYADADTTLLVHGYRWEDERLKDEPMLHDGAYGAMGGLITSIDDFSKYLSFHLRAWPPRNGEQKGPLKRSSIREMHKPFMPRLFADAKSADGTPCPVLVGYGYGLGYRQDCKGIVRISHSGGLPGFGSEYRFYPDYGVGVICFANKTYSGSPNARVLDTLLLISGIQPRKLPVSDILQKRTAQVKALLPSWDTANQQDVFAENFFLDADVALRKKETQQVFESLGKVKGYDAFQPENQLRGSFNIIGEKGKALVFFTLSPEPDAKIQQLDIELIPADQQ
jgi:CubicO group peptidase (beta-lactamase class C family)